MIDTSLRTAPTRRFLGRVDFAEALRAQETTAARVRRGEPGAVIGFESESTITLGLRGTPNDLIDPSLPFTRVDRGGRATLHNPGQLVIFPVTTTGGRGARAWVMALVDVTIRFALAHGQELHWREDEPGLYSHRGKVVSLGFRLARGVSTHGLAINVRNDLSEFDQIRTCGIANAPLDHLPTPRVLADLFETWTDLFSKTVT